MVMMQRKSLSEKSEYDEKPGIENFKTFYVIIFSSGAKRETVSRLLDLITRSQHDGGAELLVRVTHTENEGAIVEIGATLIRLLQGAEELEIMKEDKYNNIREFVFSDIHQFLKSGNDVHSLLSTAEKQRIILEMFMGIRAMEKRKLIGYSDIQLFPGQSIIQVCKNNGIIDFIFPLHETSELKLLKKKWTLRFVPISDIRNYFGEAIAFYFSFICYYTWALSVPAIIGILQSIISFDISQSYVFFATIKMIWLTVFLECWKRKSNELAYTWGTLKLVSIPKLHPTFRGRHMEIDPVTKQHVPIYPGYKRHLKVYCISLPLVILCLLFAIVVMLIYFNVEKYVIATYDDGSMYGWILTQVPGIIYAVLVYVMNVGYSYIAYVLTEWENHKVQESFDNHRIVKLLLFEFVNNFIAMGYIAFYERDLNMLKWQICIMMIVNQLFNQFQEAMLPFLLQKCRTRFKKKSTLEFCPRIQNILEQRDMWSYEELKEVMELSTIMSQLNYFSQQDCGKFSGGFKGELIIYVLVLTCTSELLFMPASHLTVDRSNCKIFRNDTLAGIDQLLQQVHRYNNGTYDDYLELFMQFGYVFLFSAVFPLAAVLAIINNVFEVWTDGFKLCNAYQRPQARPVKGIGIWQLAFEVLSLLAVMSNCALITMSPIVRSYAPDMSLSSWLLVAVVVEHTIIAVKMVVSYLISDIPKWVKVAIQKHQYESLQAVKYERKQKNKIIMQSLNLDSDKVD